MSALEFCGASVGLKARTMCHLGQALDLVGDKEQAQLMFLKARESVEVMGKVHAKNVVHDESAYEHLIDIQNRL
jgi:hypothetical protein